MVYYNANDNEAALEQFKEIAERFPTSEEAVQAVSTARLIYIDVGRVDEYALTANIKPSSLEDLNNLAHGRVKKALILYGRRALSEFLPGTPVQKLKSIVREAHSLIGDTKRANDYNQLSKLEDGSMGKTLYNFYFNRGFKFPGEKGNLGESAVRHDCVHILTGTNTDPAGEIAVSAIEATMAGSQVGWEMVTEVMVDFHLGIAWTLPGGIKPESMKYQAGIVVAI